MSVHMFKNHEIDGVKLFLRETHIHATHTCRGRHTHTRAHALVHARARTYIYAQVNVHTCTDLYEPMNL